MTYFPHGQILQLRLLYREIVTVMDSLEINASCDLDFGLNSQLIIFFASDFQWCCLTDQGSPSVMQHVVSVESPSLLLRIYLT